MSTLKHLLKKYFWFIVFYNKIWGISKARNKEFIAAVNVSADLPEKQLNVFTRHNEDGILLYLIDRVGCTDKSFIDLGSNDCMNSNCANLAFHFNWNGFFIDANQQVLLRGKYIYHRHFSNCAKLFSFTHAIVTPENINGLFIQLHTGDKIDLMSIDLDGNDYFIWESISLVNPKIVVAEVQVEKGNTEYIPVNNKKVEKHEDNVSKGASPLTMQKLAYKKEYELVAVNKGGYNMFFVRKDCMKNLEPISVHEALKKTALNII